MEYNTANKDRGDGTVGTVSVAQATAIYIGQTMINIALHVHRRHHCVV